MSTTKALGWRSPSALFAAPTSTGSSARPEPHFLRTARTPPSGAANRLLLIFSAGSSGGTPLDNTPAKWTTRSPCGETTCAQRKSHTDAMPLETPLTAKLRYPKLRQQTPVLHRSADELQVGIDSDTALIFSEPKLISVLLALDGAHHIHDIRDAGAAAGLRADEVDEAVRILDDANMLLEAGRTSWSSEAWTSPGIVEASAIRSSDAREAQQVRPGVP